MRLSVLVLFLSPVSPVFAQSNAGIGLVAASIDPCFAAGSATYSARRHAA